VAIRIKPADLEAIKTHGEETYPHECCGFLIGSSEDGVNQLHETLRADNEWPAQPGVRPSQITESHGQTPQAQPTKVESQKNRYLITPEQWKRADAHARGLGLAIIGYYHSHPDHPAAPSGFDLDHSCWPGESYMIVSIQQGKAADINSFNKPDYEKFEKELILIQE
jgi:proteasome lid subunit RPN8/RPN11